MKKFLALICLLTLVSCGAKTLGPALTVEKSVRTTVVLASNLVEPLVCDVAARTLLGTAPCLKLLDVLEPTVDLAIAYNRALRTGQPPNIVSTVNGITRLIAVIQDLVPNGPARDQALTQLATARGLAQGGK